MARRKNSPYIGFVGTGKVKSKDFTTQLDDLIENLDSNPTLLVAVNENLFNENVEQVFDYAENNDLTIETVDDSSVDSEYEADQVHEVKNVPSKFVRLLGQSPESQVIFLWDDDNDELEDVLDQCLESDLICKDATAGLQRLRIEQEDDSEGEAEESAETESEADDDDEDEEDEEPPKKKGKAKSASPSDLPEDVEDAFADLPDDLTEAGKQVAQELGRDRTTSLAQEMGLEPPKGAWARTLGKQLVAMQRGEKIPSTSSKKTSPKAEKKAEKSSGKKTAKSAAKKAAASTEDGEEPEETTSEKKTTTGVGTTYPNGQPTMRIVIEGHPDDIRPMAERMTA